jgi:hypothetical protein
LLGQELLTRTQNTHDLETQQKAHSNHFVPPDGAAQGSSSAAVVATSTANSTATATSASASHQCNECGQSFDKRHLLNTHNKKHNPPFRCPVDTCAQPFRYRKDVERHLQDRHQNTNAVAQPRRFYCRYAECQHKYRIHGVSRIDNLRRHLRSHHGG